MAQTLIKHKTTSKHKLDELFITKQEQKQETKIKLGCLPTSTII